MEKKENEIVKNEVAEKEVKEEKTVVPTLYVERESFVGNDGKEYWSYFVKGKVRNRDVKVDFSPKDKGGYEPLDILFDVQPKAQLIIGKEEMTDNITGKKSTYSTYTLKTVDTDGSEYVCGVKPSRDSDKALLGMLINTLKVKA